ncbi:MAG TPA: hypothetical protein VGZ25_13245 [Gemmataceae bacterium]|nr:hypothetical protein [Gemmataceae bacterium]
MRLHLILGLLWLGLGLAMLFPQVTGLETRNLQVGNVQFSAGWLVLAMAAYNFARWYGVYSARSLHQADAKARDRLQRSRREETPPRDPDPNFDFRDPPAAT